MGWGLRSFDVTAAFLQGMTFAEFAELTNQPERIIAFTAPPGYVKYFRELQICRDFDEDRDVMLMLKPVYGLKDAPRAWRIKLDQALSESGGRALAVDPSI